MIRCPELRCGLFVPDERRLISHLVTEHLVSPTTATEQARKAATDARIDGAVMRAAQEGAARYAPGPIVMVPKGTASPIFTPPTPKETQMPATLCNYCKRKDGSHSENCRKKDGCKRCAKRAPGDPCPVHGGVRLKPKSQREKPAVKLVTVNGKGLDAKARVMLSGAKVRVTQLRIELASEEKKVEILSELVGA